jgi:DNA-binding transcriptional MerR regulator
MAQNEAIRKAAPRTEIPDKLYFRIGDVAKLCEVPAYVLRFWETEFPQLKPNKGGTGQRLYRRRDVEMALRIKRLLYDEGYTIPGARQVFKSEQRPGKETVKDLAREKEPQLALAMEGGPATPGDARRLQKLRRELEDLHAMLSGAPVLAVPAQVQTIRAFRAPRPHLSLEAKRPGMDGLFDFQGEPAE